MSYRAEIEAIMVACNLHRDTGMQEALYRIADAADANAADMLSTKITVDDDIPTAESGAPFLIDADLTWGFPVSLRISQGDQAQTYIPQPTPAAEEQVVEAMAEAVWILREYRRQDAIPLMERHPRPTLWREAPETIRRYFRDDARAALIAVRALGVVAPGGQDGE
jgi:hypothetical protein